MSKLEPILFSSCGSYGHRCSTSVFLPGGRNILKTLLWVHKIVARVQANNPVGTEPTVSAEIIQSKVL
jgi:hypothetical protein